ncbi:unnamed protein product [Effrenium voratum]|nr:unnamed protein product [Effrenium voratum]
MPVLQSLPPEMVSQQLASQDASGNTPLHLALKAQKVDEATPPSEGWAGA